MQTRTFTFSSTGLKRAQADGSGALTVDMAFASDAPYERWFGTEILDMNASSIRLGRLNDGDGGPLLYNHNWNDLRGRHVPGSVKVHDDNVLRGQVIVPDATQLTRDTQALIESKTLSKASVGYQIHRVIEQTTAKQADGSAKVIEREIDGATFERLIEAHSLTRDGRNAGGDVGAFRRSLDAACGAFERAADDEPVYRVMDWEPLENSLCTIPADNNMGVGRAHERAHQVTPAATATAAGAATAATTAAPAPQAAAPPATPAPAGARIAGEPVLHPAAPAASTERKPHMAEAQASAGIADHTSINAVELEKQRRKAIQDTVKANRLDSRLEAKWIAEGTPLHEIAAAVLDVMEERGRLKPASASALGLSDQQTKTYSIFRAIRAMKYGANNPSFVQEAAFEIECSRAVAKNLGRDLTSNILIPGEVLTRPLGREAMERAMATSPGSKGGYMVGIETMGFIDILRNRSASLNMGVRHLSGLTGNVVFPRQTGKATVTWQGGEGTSVTATDQTLGQLSMTPKTAIAITDVSEQLLRQATPSAEAFVMADLARDVAIDGVDYAVINGTGGAQPLGIKNTPGVTTGQDAASATYAKVLAFPGVAGGVNAIRGNPGWVTNTAGALKLMQVQRFTSTDTPVWDGNLLDGTLVGFKAMSTEQVPSGNLIFGSWDEVVIGDWGVLELAMDNGGTRFNQAQVGIRAMWMVDVLLRYPQAFVVSTNLS